MPRSQKRIVMVQVAVLKEEEGGVVRTGPGFWEGTKRGAAEEGRVKGSGHSKPCEGRGHETQV